MNDNNRLLNKISEYFKNNVKLSFVPEDDVLLIANDDKVYHFNEYLFKNYSTIIYINDESLITKAIEKSIANELCDKKSLI
jgi:hypothetical protein